MTLESLVRSAARLLGVSVNRLPSDASPRHYVPVRDPYELLEDHIGGAGAILVDAGAYVGETSLKLRDHFSDATIHALEPFPDSYDRLCAAVESDPLTHTHQIALGATTRSVALHVNAGQATNSLLPSHESGASFWGEGLLETQDTVIVPALTLDEFCARQNIGHIDLLKLDVQGAEYDVLEGAAGLLDSQAIDFVFLEVLIAPTYQGQHALSEYLSLLESHGYALFGFYDLVHHQGRLIQLDMLVASRAALRRSGSSPVHEQRDGKRQNGRVQR